MINLKGIVGGYASKIQRSQVCCNSTALMDRWMFPPDDGPVPDCCGDLTGDEPLLTNGYDDTYVGRATSGTYTLPARICPITVRFTNTVSNYNPSTGEVVEIELYINAVPTLLTINGSNTFVLNPGDQIYFDATTNQLGAKACHDIHISMVNLTCNVSYNDITRMFLNGTPDCVMCPWVFTDIETSLRDYLYGPYENTTIDALSFTFTSIFTVTLNTGTNITAYYGSDPLYSNNPLLPIVINGFDAGLPQTVTINPGEFIWIYCENLGNGSLSQYEIQYDLDGICFSQSEEFVITLNRV